MNVVIDNNVAIDALRPNPDFEADAKNIFKLIGDDKLEASICANSLTDIFYVMKKVQGAENAKRTITNLVIAMNIIPLTEADCVSALGLPMNDFEDAVIAVCAKKVNADYVVSRDEKFIRAEAGIKVITPGHLLSILK